jgi:far upstream element-binding protein
MCPPEKAGKVIGHGGDKINSIQAESGASVKIQNQSDVGPGQPRRITVTGAPDRVAHAVRIVNELIAPPPQRAACDVLGVGGAGSKRGGDFHPRRSRVFR